MSLVGTRSEGAAGSAEWEFAPRGGVIAETPEGGLEGSEETEGRRCSAQGLLFGALLSVVSWAVLWLVGSTIASLLP